MLSLRFAGLVCFASIARAQRDLGSDSSLPSTTISPTAISPCTVFYTSSLAPQIGPTSTVYATTMTTQFSVVNCKYCHISNVAGNPLPSGPFTTGVTSDYLLITEIACVPTGSAITRRNALPEANAEPTALIKRGAKPQTLVAAVKKHVPLPKRVGGVRRQSPTDAADLPLALAGEAYQLAEQLFTVIYAVGVINSGADLAGTCLRLQSANAILDFAQVSLNATQASTIVCAASSPDSRLAAFNQTVIASAAAGLYGIQVAANFAGVVDAGTLCNQLDLSPLVAFGVEVDAIRTFICGTDGATSAASGISSRLLKTMTPFPNTNSSRGTYSSTSGITGTGSVGTAVTAPRISGRPASSTGAYPTSNRTMLPVDNGAGTGVSGTGNLPTTTSSHANGTTTHSTGRLPATSEAGTGTATYSPNHSSASAGSLGPITSISATGGMAQGYASSNVESWSSISYHGQESSERLPYGPTSTPRYYPKLS